ncbi:hypothetical protein BC351_24080 [Paenibacillus ferrarius]|uniref:Uncharacterized protein n=1 Tax=Paenibacillus ferrarius TaxID=1469647 RepID=A0A1V4HLS8_9BACL|nr:hypothetical protein BC351_24080 [Paenibacillus ferrarius]
MEKPVKVQAFSGNVAEKWKSLRLCRNFKHYHPEIGNKPQKDVQSQEFIDFGLNQALNDA